MTSNAATATGRPTSPMLGPISHASRPLQFILALIYIAAMNENHGPGLGELLRRLLHLVDGGAEEVYRRKGLSYRPRYTPVMRVLAGGERMIGALTSQLSISQGAVSQTVRLMEADGLVARRQGRDRRQVAVSLSTQGQALLHDLEAHWAATFRAIEGLEEELGIPIRAVLARTISALEKKGFAERIEAAEER